MPSIEIEYPDPEPDSEQEKILNECAERLSQLEYPITSEQLAQLMIDKLAEKAGSQVIEYCRLGKVLANLNADLAREQPKGLYGIGSMFQTAFLARHGAPAVPDSELERATNTLLDKFLGTLYKLAEVQR